MAADTVRVEAVTQTDGPSCGGAAAAARPARRAAHDPASGEAERAGLVRLKATCEYDGTCFCGWMVQGAEQPSVQGVLEARLAGYLRRSVAIAGSGRTDAGVSAAAQVFHVDVEPCHSAQAVLRALQSGLPPAVRVTAVEPAPPAFHARHSCAGKRYSYALLARQPSPFEARWAWSLAEKRPAGSAQLELDLAAMAGAAACLVGVHDYSHFCVRSADDPRSPVRRVHACAVADEGCGRVRVSVEADRFLYKQVRMMVGTLAQVGLGRLSVAEFAQLVLPPPQPTADGGAGAAVRPARSRSVYTAPAHGLLLERVFYAAPGEFGTSSMTPASALPTEVALPGSVRRVRRGDGDSDFDE